MGREPGFHLAQVNVARLRAPLDTPSMQAFVDGLEPINALADGSAGFVWRLQTEDGDATALRVFDDDMLIVNMSVWESVHALGAFVFRTEHADYLRRRSEWFERLADASTALWWIAAGATPTIDEAKERLELVRANGPMPEAFTLRDSFPPPEPDETAGETGGLRAPSGP
ncbi:MAG: DUF3291 domain-containing protein [Actinomycetota bacterium]